MRPRPQIGGCSTGSGSDYEQSLAHRGQLASESNERGGGQLVPLQHAAETASTKRRATPEVAIGRASRGMTARTSASLIVVPQPEIIHDDALFDLAWALIRQSRYAEAIRACESLRRCGKTIQGTGDSGASPGWDLAAMSWPWPTLGATRTWPAAIRCAIASRGRFAGRTRSRSGMRKRFRCWRDMWTSHPITRRRWATSELGQLAQRPGIDEDPVCGRATTIQAAIDQA